MAAGTASFAPPSTAPAPTPGEAPGFTQEPGNQSRGIFGKIIDFAHGIIRGIESSNGKQTVHNWTGDGHHPKIQRAVGESGNLPSSVLEEAVKNPFFRDHPIAAKIRQIAGIKGSDTSKWVKNTHPDTKRKVYSAISQITKTPENDELISKARHKRNLMVFSGLTKDPKELELLVAHAHHNYYLNTKKIYQQKGIKGIINDRGGEGNYIEKYGERLPQGHPTSILINKHLIRMR
jgi:hypothetical protein